MRRLIDTAKRWLALLAVRGAGAFIGVATTAVTTRTLGASASGYVFFTLSVVTISATVARMGLDNALVRYISVDANAQNWSRVTGTWQQSLQGTILASTAIAACIYLISQVLPLNTMGKPAFSTTLPLMAAMIPLTSVYWLCSQALIGIGRPAAATFLQNISLPAATTIILLIASAVSTPLSNVTVGALAYLFASCLTALIGLHLWTSSRPPAPPSYPGKSLWETARPLWLVAVMNQVTLWIGVFAAGIWLPPDTVAHLTAAQRASTVISLILTVTNMIVSPRYATLHASGQFNELRSLARTSTRLMAVVAFTLFVIICFLAKPIMSLFGPEFRIAAPLLVLLAIGQCINVATGSVGFLLMMTGNERDMRNIALWCGCASIALAVGLTPLFGPTGAALATVLAMAVQNIAALILVRKRLGFFTLS